MIGVTFSGSGGANNEDSVAAAAVVAEGERPDEGASSSGGCAAEGDEVTRNCRSPEDTADRRNRRSSTIPAATAAVLPRVLGLVA